jgi:hypothetical protein
VDLPNAKELAKLAAACRKAGIQTFKGGGIEFTLSDSAPAPKSTKKAAQEESTKEPTNEDLPYEQLLHWSVMGIDEEKADS